MVGSLCLRNQAESKENKGETHAHTHIHTYTHIHTQIRRFRGTGENISFIGKGESSVKLYKA